MLVMILLAVGEYEGFVDMMKSYKAETKWPLNLLLSHYNLNVYSQKQNT